MIVRKRKNLKKIASDIWDSCRDEHKAYVMAYKMFYHRQLNRYQYNAVYDYIYNLWYEDRCKKLKNGDT